MRVTVECRLAAVVGDTGAQSGGGDNGGASAASTARDNPVVMVAVAAALLILLAGGSSKGNVVMIAVPGILFVLSLNIPVQIFSWCHGVVNW